MTKIKYQAQCFTESRICNKITKVVTLEKGKCIIFSQWSFSKKILEQKKKNTALDEESSNKYVCTLQNCLPLKIVNWRVFTFNHLTLLISNKRGWVVLHIIFMGILGYGHDQNMCNIYYVIHMLYISIANLITI